MKEDRSKYESMSLHSRRGFFQSLVALATVAVLPVPIGVVLDQEPILWETGWHYHEIYLNYKSEQVSVFKYMIDGVVIGDVEGCVVDEYKCVKVEGHMI